MAAEPPIAFPAGLPDPPGLEIRVNFGVFAGREATPAELDELGRSLLHAVDQVTIVSERRHELGTHAEATLHQVRIEVPWSILPDDVVEVEWTRDRLVYIGEHWARACIDERHADVVELWPGDGLGAGG